jgi:hypothetical protein
MFLRTLVAPAQRGCGAIWFGVVRRIHILGGLINEYQHVA